MNLLEQYIIEIHSVDPCSEEWTLKWAKNKKFVVADITTDCYGRKQRLARVFSEDEWSEAKEKGYYMA